MSRIDNFFVIAPVFILNSIIRLFILMIFDIKDVRLVSIAIAAPAL